MSVQGAGEAGEASDTPVQKKPPRTLSSTNLPKRELLSFITVWALPKASNTGLHCGSGGAVRENQGGLLHFGAQGRAGTPTHGHDFDFDGVPLAFPGAGIAFLAVLGAGDVHNLPCGPHPAPRHERRFSRKGAPVLLHRHPVEDAPGE